MKKAYSLIEVSVIMFFVILLGGIAYVTFGQSKSDTKFNQMKMSFSAISSMEKNYYEGNTDFTTESDQIMSYLSNVNTEAYTITSLTLVADTDYNKLSVSKNINSVRANFGVAAIDNEYCYRLLLSFDITTKQWSEEISRTTTLTCSGDNITQ